MARKRDRAIAMFFAVIFIISSCALTAAVVWQMIEGDKKPDTTADTTTQSKERNYALQGTALANFTPWQTSTNYQSTDTTPGTGKEVKAGETVTVDYTGAVAATGVIFQSSKDTGQPVSFPLSGVIAGWSQGVPGMKEGGTRRLLIPAAMAYGANPPARFGHPSQRRSGL